MVHEARKYMHRYAPPAYLVLWIVNPISDAPCQMVLFQSTVLFSIACLSTLCPYMSEIEFNLRPIGREMSVRGVDQTVHDFGLLNKMLKMFATCPCILVFFIVIFITWVVFSSFYL